DLPLDAADARHRLIRRKLVGDRPARRAREEADARLIGAPVELVDDAVDLVREGAAALAERAVVLEAAGDARDRAGLGRDRKSEAAQQLEQLPLPRRQRAAFDGAEAVEEGRERPRGGDARIELAQAPGGGVARVDEHLLAARARLIVHALEAGDRHEHLAA